MLLDDAATGERNEAHELQALHVEPVQAHSTRAGAPPSPPLVAFHVDSHFSGGESIRAVTLFCLRVKVVNPIPASFSASLSAPTSTLPHLRCVNPELSTVTWEVMEKHIQRRYSEVMLLRELLRYQFPHLIIPPLPPKDLGASMDSFFAAEDELAVQQFNIGMFLRSVVAYHPEIVSLCPLFKAFATHDRAMMESETLPRMNEKVQAYRRANKDLVDFSGPRREFSSSAATALSRAASYVSRSASRWLSSAAAITSSTASTAGSTTSIHEGGSEEVQEVCEYWRGVSSSMVLQRGHLEKAAKDVLHACKYQNLKDAEDEKIAAAIQELSVEISTCEEVPAETRGSAAAFLKDFSQITTDVVKIEKCGREVHLQKAYLSLAYEAYYAKAVLFAVDDITALFRYLESGRAFEAHSEAWREALQSSQSLNDKLKRSFEDVYLPAARQRIAYVLRSVHGTVRNTAAAVNEYHLKTKLSMPVLRSHSKAAGGVVDGERERENE